MMASYNVAILLVGCLWNMDIVQVRGKCDLVSIGRKYIQCANKHHSLHDLIAHNSHISGQDLIHGFSQFCSATDAIHSCVTDHAHESGCINSEEGLKVLHEHYERSEFYCDGDEVTTALSDVFIHLPPTATNPQTDECLKMAAHRRELCSIEKALSLSIKGIATTHEKRVALADSMICTYKGFGMGNCPLDTGLITTIILYAEMIVPPVFGVNVTSPLMSMIHYYEQHGELLLI